MAEETKAMIEKKIKIQNILCCFGFYKMKPISTKLSFKKSNFYR